MPWYMASFQAELDQRGFDLAAARKRALEVRIADVFFF